MYLSVHWARVLLLSRIHTHLNGEKRMLRLLIVDQDVAFRREMSRAFGLLGTLRVELASGSEEMLKVAVENWVKAQFQLKQSTGSG